MLPRRQCVAGVMFYVVALMYIVIRELILSFQFTDRQPCVQKHIPYLQHIWDAHSGDVS
jgi:hypothetical protein